MVLLQEKELSARDVAARVMQVQSRYFETGDCIGDNFRQKLEIWSRNPATAQRQVE